MLAQVTDQNNCCAEIRVLDEMNRERSAREVCCKCVTNSDFMGRCNIPGAPAARKQAAKFNNCQPTDCRIGPGLMNASNRSDCGSFTYHLARALVST